MTAETTIMHKGHELTLWKVAAERCGAPQGWLRGQLWGGHTGPKLTRWTTGRGGPLANTYVREEDVRALYAERQSRPRLTEYPAESGPLAKTAVA